MDEQVLGKIFNLDKEGSEIPNSWQLSLEFKVSHEIMVGILMSLDANKYIKTKKKSEKKFQLTKEGIQSILL